MVSPNGPGGVLDNMHAKSALIVQLALGFSVPPPMCDVARGALVGVDCGIPHLFLIYLWLSRVFRTPGEGVAGGACTACDRQAGV